MRHINFQEVEQKISNAWREKAQQALEAVTECDENERKVEINKHSKVWQDPELKRALQEVSHDKCWYCESRQVRSDKSVDHFRPKNKVVECPNHPGYWWLAFDLSNYRLSCTYCNSRRKDRENETTGGKHDHFPLVDESHRVYEGDTSNEQPVLFDPITYTDPGLLWFIPDGTVIPKYSKEDHSLHHHRAMGSIELYHLNHVDIREERQELCNFINRKVEDGNLFFIRSSQGDDTARQAWESVLHDLYELIQNDSEYSANARAMISFISKKHLWVEATLQVI